MRNITEIFREKKLKLTPQRIAVYDYLLGTKKHPSAEAIYQALQDSFPTMSLATVYKSLKTLVEVELVSEINLGEGNFRYDATVEDHPHIQCMECGKVEDVMGMSLSSLNREVTKFTDYQILHTKIYYYGICRSCNRQ